MAASRREIITSAAAGGFLAAIGMPVSLARSAEAAPVPPPVPGLDAEQAEWLADIDRFVRYFRGQTELHDMIMLTNRLMISGYPELFSAKDSVQRMPGPFDTTRVAHKQFKFRYAIEPTLFEPIPAVGDDYSRSAIERVETSKAEMRQIFGEVAVLEAVSETIALQEHERRAGRAWRPYMPLYSIGIRPDPSTLQPTLTFETLYARADLDA